MQVTAAELRSGPHLSYNHDGNVVAQQPGAAAARVYVSKLLVQDYHEVMAADKDIDGDISDAPTTFTVAVQFPRDVTDISLNHVSRAAYAQAANAYNRKMFGPLPPSEASKHIFPEMAPMVGELNSADIAILAAAHVFKPTSLTAMAVAIGAMETSNPQAWAAEVDLIDYITSLSVPVHMYNTCSILTVARLFYEAALCMYLESGADADTCNNKLAVVDHFKRTVKAAPALQTVAPTPHGHCRSTNESAYVRQTFQRRQRNHHTVVQGVSPVAVCVRHHRNWKHNRYRQSNPRINDANDRAGVPNHRDKHVGPVF